MSPPTSPYGRPPQKGPQIRMKISRSPRHPHRLLSAALVAAAAGALLTAGPVAAGTEPTTPDSVPATDSSTPADPAAPAAEEGSAELEIVQSWTLTPGGGQDGDQASNRPDLTYQVAPGATIEDTVIVYNLGNVPLLFRIYATDAFNNDDGQFDLIPGADVPVDAGSWVEIAQETLTLEPGKQATIPITITVPIDATPGDHVGAVVAANVVQADNGGGQIISVERRTGTRLYLQVEGPLNPELAVVGLTTDYSHAANPFGGTADIAFTIENRGNVRLGGTPVVEFSGPLGLAKKQVTLDPIPELLPGEKIALTATIEGAPALFLDTTTVTLDAADVGERGDGTSTVGKDRLFAPPVLVLAIALIVILAVLARRAYRRRQQAALPVAPISGPPPALEADSREPQHQ